MALDEALAESVRAGGLPFLRFYTWAPSTLSLGRFQNQETGLSSEARALPRVRRSTGGGAIWHDNELTYSLGCTQDDVGCTGVKASFEKLCGFLLDTWNGLGWDARFAKDARQTSSLGNFTPACFAGQEEYDILVGGKKLGGNAQRRDKGSIFQHGSVPVCLDREALERIFLPGFRPEAGSTTDLRANGWARPVSELTPLLVAAFQTRLSNSWTSEGPDDREWERAEVLVQERFGADGWTETGGGSLRPLS